MATKMQRSFTDPDLLKDSKVTVVLWSQREASRPLDIDDLQDWLRLEPEKLSMLLAALLGYKVRFNLYWDTHICLMKPSQSDMFDPICNVTEIARSADQMSAYLNKWAQMRAPDSEYWPRDLSGSVMDALNSAVLKIASSVSLRFVCRDLHGNEGIIAVPARPSLLPPPIADSVPFAMNGAKLSKCLIGRTSSGLPCLFRAPMGDMPEVPEGLVVDTKTLKFIRARPITLGSGVD